MPGSDSEYEHISEKMRDLIRLLLTPNPDKRPSIIELLKIVQNFDKLPMI
jgi:serine/threonine protein kinase